LSAQAQVTAWARATRATAVSGGWATASRWAGAPERGAWLGHGPIWPMGRARNAGPVKKEKGSARVGPRPNAQCARVGPWAKEKSVNGNWAAVEIFQAGPNE
jgi:hypothetical protein